MIESGLWLSAFTASTILAYKLNSTVKYYVKFLILSAYTNAGVVLSLPFMLLRPFSHKNALFTAKCIMICANTVLGVTWEVRGLENIDNTEGCVLLINHQSFLDVTVLGILWHVMEYGTCVVKKSIFWMWPLGIGAWLWGTVFIDRSKVGKAMASISQQADAIKERKAKLFLFPEGTRNSNDELLPFKKGGFHASLQAGAPIQPVVVSRYHFIDHEKKYFNSGHFIVTILPKIETTNYDKDSIDDLVTKTRNIMQEVFTKTTQESLLKNSKIRISKMSKSS